MATEKRLIWADALNEVIEKTDWYSVSNGKLTHGATTFTGLFKATDIFDAIENAPAVDAVEVKHGRWVIEKRKTLSRNPYMDDNYHAHATCSECGFCIHSENASFGYPELNTTNYCPNCGAKMDGDRK